MRRPPKKRNPVARVVRGLRQKIVPHKLIEARERMSKEMLEEWLDGSNDEE